jgi:DNA-directed RNA polymerase subunit F
MIKRILEEEPLTLAEIKDLLQKFEGDESAGYELRRAIEHSKKFAKLSIEDSKKLVEELMQLEKMRKDIAVKIADILPLSPTEIRAIYAKERYNLNEEDIKRILEIVSKYA